LENGRKKCGAAMAGETYPKGAGDVAIVVEAKEAEAAERTTSVLPALQSPMHEHCFDLPSVF